MSAVVIVGGGLAGGAAAARLARAGAAVHLLERQAGPHDKICGEFLSVEGWRDLAGLGLDPLRLGAVAIDRVRLVSGPREVAAPLPFTALGISRRRLDEALLDFAAAGGARIARGVRATGLEGGMVQTSAGALPASRVLLATGKHDLRGLPRRDAPERDGYVGFKMHWRADARARAALDRHIELVLFPGGYAGLQLVAPDVMNLCLIVRRGVLAQAGGSWEALLLQLLREPGLARRIEEAEPLFARPLAIANLPYGYLRDPAAALPAGVYCLGDQAAMTASLTGDGMALALCSARLAAPAVLTGEPPARYHAALRAAVGTQLRRAMWLQRAAESPLARNAGFAVLRLWPRLLESLAGATRLPQESPA